MNFGVSVITILGQLTNADEYWPVAAFIYLLYAAVIVIVTGSERLAGETTSRDM